MMREDRKGSFIEVGMAEMKIASAPEVLITRGLGSCVGIVLYEPLSKIGGLAHPMLPDIEKAKIKSNRAKFVNSVVEAMVEELIKKGARKTALIAKIFGGGHMFSAIPYDSPFNIGIKNVSKAKEVLNSLKIRIVAEDTGGNYGRTIEFHLSTGEVKVKTLFHGVKQV